MDADLQAAFQYTFPLYEMARTRFMAVEATANPNRGAVNRIGHRRVLSNHTNRNVTAPNNDTLYSSAWLDLAAGPIEVTVPPMGQRYWSVQFMDAYTSTAAVIGSGNGLNPAGNGAIKLWITLDSDAGPAPAGTRAVRLPTRDAWMLVRILVDDAADAAEVHKLQDAMTLRVVNPPAGALTNPAAPKTALGSPADGASYLSVVGSMLARNPVPAAQALLVTWQKLGLQPGALASDAAAALWTTALPALNQNVRNRGLDAGSTTIQRWRYPNSEIGVFGSNYALRASVALAGLGALPTSEALYLSAVSDNQDQPLNGQFKYRVKIPPGGLAARAFWSLSMYQVEPDGRLFFADNPISRYTVGDRTRGMVKNADGSMDIILQRDEPADAAQKANWLPSPAGTMRLMLRAYLPSLELAQGKAPLPTIERLP